MNSIYYAKKYVEIFPEDKIVLEKHLNDYGELLGHVFYGDIINNNLVELLASEVNVCKIKKVFKFLNDMYANGDEDIRNVVEVTILEYLGDDYSILRKAFKYLSNELKDTSIIIETQLGRNPFSMFNS